MNHRISTRLTIATSVLSLTLVAPILASAHTYTNSGELAIIGGEAVSASVGIGGSASTHTGSTNVGIESDSDARIETGAHESDSQTSSTTGGDSLNAHGTVGTMTDESMKALTINRSNLSSDTTSSVGSSAQVMTRDDLNAYASSVIRDDTRVQGIEFANDSVSLKYHEPAKLFGFIPVTMTTRTVVDAHGTVTMSYPWYHFLVSSKDMSAVRADIEAHAKAMLAAQGTGQGGAHLSAKAQAELLDQIRVALESVALAAQTKSDASAHTGTDTKATASTSANGGSNSGE